MKIDFDFKDPNKQRLILMILGGLIASVLYITLLLKPTYANLAEINPRVWKLNQDIKRTEGLIKKRPGLEKQLKELESKIRGYRTMLSAAEEIPSLLEELSEMAHRSNVKIIGIKPEKITAEEPGKKTIFQEVPIFIKARCGYHRLGHFISRLENADRIFAIRDIEIIGRPQTPRSHDVSLIISTFLISES